MSITDQFWLYAKEAILWAAIAKTDKDRQSLLELARTWIKQHYKCGSFPLRVSLVRLVRMELAMSPKLFLTINVPSAASQQCTPLPSNIRRAAALH
jgi:hypothetical protein